MFILSIQKESKAIQFYWYFNQNVMVAMQSSAMRKIVGKAKVDETAVVEEQEKGGKGRKNKKKNWWFLPLRNQGRSKPHVWTRRKTKQLKIIAIFYGGSTAKRYTLKTDKWKGYNPLKKDFCDLE